MLLFSLYVGNKFPPLPGGALQCIVHGMLAAYKSPRVTLHQGLQFLAPLQLKCNLAKIGLGKE
jgi:hypothetical protein